MLGGSRANRPFYSEKTRGRGKRLPTPGQKKASERKRENQARNQEVLAREARSRRISVHALVIEKYQREVWPLIKTHREADRAYEAARLRKIKEEERRNRERRKVYGY